MSPTEPAHERRLHVRVPVRGDVTFQIGDHEVHGRIVTVSDAALDIRCQLGFAILGMAGQPVDIAVVLDDHRRWKLTGHVQFVRASTHTLVIAYDAPAPDLAREIEARLTDSRADAAALQMMILTRERDDRERSHSDAAYERADSVRKPEAT